MTYLFYFLAAAWSLTIIGAWLYATAEMWDESIGIGVIFTFVVGPLAFLMACLPWAIMQDETSPDLVTLKKGEWACVSQHSETTMVPISTGKTTTLVPQTNSVCDQYGRIR